ncbi:hypothetical protein BC827DRAFT_456755 [Russula dissimulans]|nr:hypothetical protein BC827DRAFT_456755 [Russula dissimulans]
MGASQSKQDDEQVFYNPVPIQVSSELATQLSDTSLSPKVSPARHTILDQTVRAKISAEAARLRGQPPSDDASNNNKGDDGVDIVRREIEAALERENLDRERAMAGDSPSSSSDASTHGDVKNSTALLGDLEQVRQKVDRYRVRASLTDHPEVKEAREAVLSCYQCVLSPSRFSRFLICFFSLYRANPQVTLNCWSEVAAFRGAVAKLEHQYVDSLR